MASCIRPTTRKGKPMTYFMILAMIFAHIVDDWVLQGKLANFKQRSWWLEVAPD